MIGPIPALAELARLRERLDAFGARLAQFQRGLATLISPGLYRAVTLHQEAAE